MNEVTSVADVVKILERTVVIANLALETGSLIYGDGTANEKRLFLFLQEASELEGFSRDSAELISGHKFPDVVFASAKIGVEIKGHKQGDRILGNSIMGSTLSIENAERIYLLAWNDSEKNVIWRDYFECVVGAEVTHSPRFVLKPNCETEESLFGRGEHQIGDAQEVCLGNGGFKSEVILARMRAKALAEGNIPWWISPQDDDEVHVAHDAQSQLSIVKYSSLDPGLERPSFLKTLLIGFPELFGKSPTKYDSALVWALLRKGILISRDVFSAGGQIEHRIPSICSSHPLKLPKLFDRAKISFGSTAIVKKSEIEDIWQLKNLSPENLLQQIKSRILNSGVASYRSAVLHNECTCSQLKEDDFSQGITDWLLENFNINSVV